MHGHLPLWPVFLKQIPDTYSAKDPNFSAVEPPVCTTKLLWVPYQQPVTNTVLGRLMDSRHEGNQIDLFVKSNEYDLAWLNDTVAAQRQQGREPPSLEDFNCEAGQVIYALTTLEDGDENNALYFHLNSVSVTVKSVDKPDVSFEAKNRSTPLATLITLTRI